MIEPVGAGNIASAREVLRADLITVASCKLIGKVLIILRHTFYFPPIIDGKQNHDRCKERKENGE